MQLEENVDAERKARQSAEAEKESLAKQLESYRLDVVALQTQLRAMEATTAESQKTVTTLTNQQVAELKTRLMYAHLDIMSVVL